MTQLHRIAIRYLLHDQVQSNGRIDRPVFRSAVTRYRNWCPWASDEDARATVSAILLEVIGADPACFWKDGRGANSAA